MARAKKWPDFHGGNKRASNGKLSRFAGVAHHATQAEAGLRADHPALRAGRTMFPNSVVHAADSPRLLVSGFNSAKIGSTVLKGAWRGLPIYTLTLEERATCPASCSLWAECYGNAMPFARRHMHGEALEERLAHELHVLGLQHYRGFVVRVHVLGDFYSVEYAALWMRWLYQIPHLRVFGYTARPVGDPIGKIIAQGNRFYPGRCAIRFSVPSTSDHAPMQATTIWREADGATFPDEIVCPANTGRTDCCGTCALCWSPAAAEKRIVFIGHGMRSRGAAA